MQSISYKLRSVRSCSSSIKPRIDGSDVRPADATITRAQLRSALPLSKAMSPCPSAQQPGGRHALVSPPHAQPPSLGMFPSGKKQAILQLPAMMLYIDVAQLGEDATLAAVEEVVGSGVTAVVLTDESGNAGALYESACKLKETIRGRCLLFLVDRTDIAQAAEADGVLMTDQGVPTVVAKRMIGDSSCLVGRIVTSAESAVTAAADGASLVLVTGPGGALPELGVLLESKSKQRSGNAIPVIMAFSQASSSASAIQASACWSDNTTAPAAKLDGLCTTLALLSETAKAATPAAGKATSRTLSQDVDRILSRLQGRVAAAPPSSYQPPAQGTTLADSNDSANLSWVRKLLTEEREGLLAEEKASLMEVAGFLQELIPDLPELLLLQDAVKQLDDLFLMVVVGEFNSGKSSMINALLGNKFVKEGILPTTNEISILKYGKEEDSECQADGLFVRRLPAQLLQEISIVDTPGTNVILDRQQRLTEEYVPRADLVVFVMSADRPFSESEVKFLEYIRQWRKKVVFVVNKADMLSSIDEVEEVKEFVAANAQRLLGVDTPNVLAVSSRAALKAKLQAAQDRNSTGLLDSYEEEALVNNPEWKASGFASFESFVYNFLIGGSGEGARLKLQTPLNIADALLVASKAKLDADIAAAAAELRAVTLVTQELEKFRGAMSRDAEAQRDVLGKAVSDASTRWTNIIDETLQVSNLASVSKYVLGNNGGDPATTNRKGESALKAAVEAARLVTADHTNWLASNCDSQISYYTTFIEGRRQALLEAGAPVSEPGAVIAPVSVASSSASLVSLMDAKAVSVKLDDELRDTVVRTTATAAGGPATALVLDALINNAFEETLILLIAGLASYVSLLNLPLRRAEIKKSVAQNLGLFVEAAQKEMEKELNVKVGSTVSHINALVAPIQRDCQAELARLQKSEEQRASLERQVAELIRRTADVE